MAQQEEKQNQEEAPPGYKIVGYEKQIRHTYEISGKQLKDNMELTVHDSVTKKTWYKKFNQADFSIAIKEVYGTIKQANNEQKIVFTFPDQDPDNGSLGMNVDGQFILDLPPQNAQ